MRRGKNQMSHEHKQKVTAVFDTASEGYDNPSQRFFVNTASFLVESMRLSGGEQLLDVATGTGHVAVAAAQALKDGKVTGIDISDGMLQRAKAKAAALGLTNVEFLRRDIEDMGFADGAFDAATCSFGLFFLPDIEKGLRCISRVIKPGGRLHLTSFAPSMMQPMRGMLNDLLKTRHGIETPLFSARMDSPEKIAALLEAAGYRDIKIQSAQMGYYLKDSGQWRDILLNTAYRNQFQKLSEEEVERLLDEHLAEVDRLADANGIWLDVEVLFAEGAV